MSRSVRLVLAAALAAAFTLSSISSSGAFVSSQPGVHDWLFDTSGTGGVDTKAEAVTVAHRYDIVVAAQRYQPFLSAMKAAKPGIVVAEYHKGTSVYGSDFTWIKANHPSWLLHTPTGALLKSSYGTYLIDVGNPAVRTWMADYAKGQQAAGWTGVYLDSMGLYGFSGFSGSPVNPRTGKLFTTSEWIAAETGLAQTVDNAITIPLLINGLRTGPGYWSDTSPLVSGIEAGEFEGCFRDASAKISGLPVHGQLAGDGARAPGRPVQGPLGAVLDEDLDDGHRRRRSTHGTASRWPRSCSPTKAMSTSTSPAIAATTATPGTATTRSRSAAPAAR